MKTIIFYGRATVLFLLMCCIFHLTSNAQQTTFKVSVTGTGKPVLFIPGYCCTGEVWKETVAALDSGKFECHVLSLAGFGGVKGIQTDTYLKDIAKGIEDYIRSEQLNDLVIIGHSMGGLLALMIGIDLGDSIKKIVCVDSWPYTPAAINPNAKVETQITMARTYFKYDSISLGMQYPGSRNEIRPYLEIHTKSSDKTELLLDMTFSSDFRIAQQAMYDMFTIDTRDMLGKISAPVMILGTWMAYRNYGVTEDSMKEAFQLQYKNLNNKEIHVHSDSRHFIMWDAPEWFMYYIRRFIS